MTAVFISYRRDDSAAATSTLYDVLARRYKPRNVFRDVESIPAGASFESYITIALQVCDVMLVVIGPRWLSLPNDAGTRRLDDPTDLVRLEIASALRQNKLVMPLLVDGATMPAASELPADVAGLASLQAISIRDMHLDATSVARQIDSYPRWPIPHAEALGAAITLPVGWGAVVWMLTSSAAPDVGVVAPIAAGCLGPWLLTIVRVVSQRQWVWFQALLMPMVLLVASAFLAWLVPAPVWLMLAVSALAVATNAVLLTFYGLRGPRYTSATNDSRRDVGRLVTAVAPAGVAAAGGLAATAPLAQRSGGGWRRAIIACALVALICLAATIACFATSASFASQQWLWGTLIFLPGVLFGFAALAIAYVRLMRHDISIVPTSADVVRPWGGYVPSTVPEYTSMWRRMGWAAAITFLPTLVGIGFFARPAQSSVNSPLFGVYIAVFAALFPIAALIYALVNKAA